MNNNLHNKKKKKKLISLFFLSLITYTTIYYNYYQSNLSRLFLCIYECLFLYFSPDIETRNALEALWSKFKTSKPEVLIGFEMITTICDIHPKQDAAAHLKEFVQRNYPNKDPNKWVADINESLHSPIFKAYLDADSIKHIFKSLILHILNLPLYKYIIFIIIFYALFIFFMCSFYNHLTIHRDC